MRDWAIKVEGLGKKYRIGKSKSGDLRESFGNFLRRFKPNQQINKSTNQHLGEFWALKDVSFEIPTGEAVGIIGRNGAGKSTLLKLLSRITEPTTGRIELYGRVSSLLEVGTGFHPELTGRENIYLNGTILGMKRREVKEKFDEIVAFSGVEKFIETPIKHFSSGMMVRLAFSVAAHLEPEILLIDEVLAVGDAEFQEKCLGKMKDVAGHGRTVILVSHNMGAIRKLCQNTIVLNKGKIDRTGKSSEMINYYLNNNNLSASSNCHFQLPTQYDFSLLELIEINLFNSENIRKSNFLNSECIKIKLSVRAKEDIVNYKLGIDLTDQNGIILFTSYHNDINNLTPKMTLQKGDYVFIVELPKYQFNEGVYHIGVSFGIHLVKWVFKLDNVCSFSIDFNIQNEYFQANKRTTPLAPMLNWSILEGL